MSDEAQDKAERKRLKKLKKLARQQEQEAAEAAEAAEEEAAAEEQGEKKKKKKKKNREAASEAPADGDDDSAEAAAEDEPPRKKSKKSKEAAAAQEDGDGEEEEDDGGEKKKKKKKKHAENPDKAFVAHLSKDKVSVGDKAAAASGQKIKKAFYKEHKEVASMSHADVEATRAKLQISVESKDGIEYRPISKFEHAGFSAEIMESCKTFKQPSPIQSQCWPIVLSGHDMIGIAATGSGKTLAFTLPGIVHIQAQPPVKQGEPIMLVLAPTRELAMQSAEVAESAGRPCNVRSVCVYGGAPKPPQKAALRSGVEIVVATPGRLQDLMEEGALSLKRVTFFVLDEADRMLDLGFEPAIRAIAGAVRSDRQTLMFSATWPESIQALAAEFLASPVMVRIGAAGTRAAHSITQIVEVIEDRARDERLEQLLAEYHGQKNSKRRCIIFVLYKKEATRVGEMLRRRGWNAHEIQGDMPQKQRTETVQRFKDGTAPLLIATDVAARGLDIPGVECVLNYSFPLTIEDYVHRIGRTGRAGATGIAHTFFCVGDKSHAGELVNVLREAKQPVPPELLKFGTHVKKKESKLYGAHFKDIDTSKKATKVVFGDDSDDD